MARAATSPYALIGSALDYDASEYLLASGEHTFAAALRIAALRVRVVVDEEGSPNSASVPTMVAR